MNHHRPAPDVRERLGAALPLALPPPAAASPPPAEMAPHTANGSTSPIDPRPETTATHPASWQAMLHASLFDDDVTSLAPEQRARREALDRLRAEYLQAKASDGILDKDEGRALREKAHELGTDRMSFADSMYARGMDPAQVHAVLEKLRNVDSAAPGAGAVERHDHLGQPMAPPSSVSPAEQRLWMEAMANRYDDLHAGYTTSSGATVAGTPLEKLIDDRQGRSLATGLYKGQPSPPTVGGFFGMAAHTAGLAPGRRMQTWGLDSNYHASKDVGYFDTNTLRWTESAAGPGGHVDKLAFETTPEIQAKTAVPMGSAAVDLMQREAERLQASTARSADGRVVEEYVPEIFAQRRDQSGGLVMDAATQRPALQNVETFERRLVDGNSNPYTGWGFGATRRALDSAGNGLAVLDNQELRIRGEGARVPIPPQSRLAEVLATGAERPLAEFLPDSTGAVRPNVVTTDSSRLQAYAALRAAATLGKGP